MTSPPSLTNFFFIVGMILETILGFGDGGKGRAKVKGTGAGKMAARHHSSPRLYHLKLIHCNVDT